MVWAPQNLKKKKKRDSEVYNLFLLFLFSLRWHLIHSTQLIAKKRAPQSATGNTGEGYNRSQKDIHIGTLTHGSVDKAVCPQIDHIGQFHLESTAEKKKIVYTSHTTIVLLTFPTCLASSYT